MIKNFNIAKFIRQIRQELRKVTWPGRQETLLSSVMVAIFAFIAAMYFLAADAMISRVVKLLLKLGD